MTVESQPSPSSRIASFHAEDVEQVENYRTMSKLALVALLLGLAAPVCLLAPLLFSVPILGAVISVAALRHIARSEGALAGRAAAICGLAFCVATLLASISYSAVTKHLRSAQAADFAQQWISLLLSGKTEDAYRLTATGSRPTPPPGPDEPPARQANPYEQFTKNATIEALVAAGEGATIQSPRTLGYEPRPLGQCTVVQQFHVTPQAAASSGENASHNPTDVVLTLERSPTDARRAPQWLVRNFQNP